MSSTRERYAVNEDEAYGAYIAMSSLANMESRLILVENTSLAKIVMSSFSNGAGLPVADT
jgi:hypothetical protein